MWRLTGTTANGRTVDVPFVEIETLVPRSRVLNAARRLLQQRAGPSPLATLEREIASEDPLPGIDGIDSWGAQAADSIGPPELLSGLQFHRIGQTAAGLEVMGLTWFDAPSPSAMAFHPPDTIIADVSGLQEVVFTESGGTQLEIIEPYERSATFLEWRAYLGAGTLVVEGESELEPVPASKELTKSARVRLLGCPALLIGRVLEWMGRPVEPSHDQFRHARLKHYELKLPAVAQAYPNIELFVSVPHQFRQIHGEQKRGPALVFVHGTFSCSLPSLTLLHPLQINAFRFEHDTFHSIADNVALLSQAVLTHLKPDPLYLVAHSRGGLVARLAARELTAKGVRVIVRTYGTPHLGTPLANAGGKFLSALLAMGRTVSGGLFGWDPVSLAGKLALKALCWSNTLPEGLEVMRTDTGELKSLNFGKEPFELISYGGNYDLRKLADGACAYAMGVIAHEGFSRKQNDLVVPTESALGVGDPRPVLEPCDHFHYFSTEVLRRELQTL
jgi:hypothetical protein